MFFISQMLNIIHEVCFSSLLLYVHSLMQGVCTFELKTQNLDCNCSHLEMERVSILLCC